MSSSELPAYAVRNRARWTKSNAEYVHEHGVRAWRQNEISWGSVGDAGVGARCACPEVDGKDVIELGCGTAYFSAWLARRGRATGRRRHHAGAARDRAADAAETGIEFAAPRGERGETCRCPTHRSTSRSPSTARRSGAIAYKWIPEAARLLRPGGELVFLRNSTISMLCAALDGWHETLQRPQRGLHRLDWEDDDTTEFQLGHGDLFKLLRRIGIRRARPGRALRAGRGTDADYYLSTADGRKSGRGRRSGRLGSGELARRPAAPACVDEPAAARDPRPARNPVRRSRADVRRGGPAEGQRGPARARARARQGALGRRAGRRSARARRRHRRFARWEDLRQAGER